METPSSKKRSRDRGGRSSGESTLVGVATYMNKLPDIPIGGKMLDYKFDPDKFIKYKPTSLEQKYQFELCHDKYLGLDIDMVNATSWESPWTRLDYMQPVSKIRKPDGPPLPFADYLEKNRDRILIISNEAHQHGSVAAPDSTLPFVTQISLIPKKELSLLYYAKFLPEKVRAKLPEVFASVPFLKRTEYISARRERTSALVFNNNEDEFQSILAKIIEDRENKQLQGKTTPSVHVPNEQPEQQQQQFLKNAIEKIEKSFDSIECHHSIAHPLGKAGATIEYEWDVIPDPLWDPSSHFAIAQLEIPEKPLLDLVSDTLKNHRNSVDSFGIVILPFAKDEPRTTSILDENIDATVENPLMQPVSVLIPNSGHDGEPVRAIWYKVFKGECISLKASLHGRGSYCFRFEEHDDEKNVETRSNIQNAPKIPTEKKKILAQTKFGLAKYSPLNSQILLRKATFQDRDFVNSKRATTYTLARQSS